MDYNKVKTEIIDSIYSHFKESENPDEVMTDLITDSIETGIGYWCDELPDLPTDKIWDEVKEEKKTLQFGSAEDEEYGVLTLKTISRAFDRLKTDNPEVYENITEENWDADDCDVFFQTAIFGEVIYG